MDFSRGTRQLCCASQNLNNILSLHMWHAFIARPFLFLSFLLFAAKATSIEKPSPLGATKLVALVVLDEKPGL